MRDHVCDCGATLPVARDPADPDWWIGRCGCGTRHAVHDPLPRDGKAAWWTSECVYSATVDLPIGDTSVEIAVRAEVPMSAENYRVHRRGNRYWPTTVQVELGGADLDLLPQTARELGQRLIDAADAADAIDKPDTDTCGHWAPCGCGRTFCPGCHQRGRRIWI